MSLIGLGLQDGVAPSGLLQRAAVDADGLPAALSALSALPDVREVVVLSTCTRTEVYAVAEAEAEDAAFEGIAAWFATRVGDHGGTTTRGHLRALRGTDVARHLSEVTAGLHSPVLGDRDVLGQVRAAWRAATSVEAAGPELGLLVRHALAAAKRVHSETPLGRSTDSIPSAVAEMVRARLNPMARRADVLVVGAGAMGAGIVSSLDAQLVAQLAVANRTPARAREVAGGAGGTAIGLDDVADALAAADVVCVAVGRDRPVLDEAVVAAAMRRRPSRPLLVVDVGVPRGVAPEVSTIPGVCRLDLKDVRRHASQTRGDRIHDVRRAEAIVAEELDRYEQASSCRHAAPVLAALHSWGESVRRAELDRLAPRLDGLTNEQVAVVETLTRRLMGKLLHAPSACIRQAAGTPHGEWLAEVAHEILGVTPQGVDVGDDVAHLVRVGDEERTPRP